MDVNWQPFDYKNKHETAPPPQRLVWIYELWYYDRAIGYFDGDTFRVWNGSDDCHVKYWAEIEWPNVPVLVEEDDDDL